MSRNSPRPPQPTSEDRSRRLGEELARYDDCLEVHDLPEIYHFWSSRFLQPALQSFGVESVDQFFLRFLLRACERRKDATCQFVSLGSGNCDLEIALGRALVAQGCKNFRFCCWELSGAMIERGRANAAQSGLASLFEFHVGEVLEWTPTADDTDACLANHSLHHFVELEEIFARVHRAIGPSGCFLVNDMIGRNGHMRWPEALRYITALWAELPNSKKHNRQLRRLETQFDNWDCSNEGNEGIRAEDILPLLVERFSFEAFIGFGNLIDIFVDRNFGPNFDATDPRDRSFINAVALLDDALIDAGVLTPTHMIAALGTTPVDEPRYYRGRSPARSVRPTGAERDVPSPASHITDQLQR